MFSSSMTCTTSSKETVFLTFGPQSVVFRIIKRKSGISPVVRYVGSRKRRVAAVEEKFYIMVFQSSNLLRLYAFNWFILALHGQLFLFWSNPQRFPYKGGVSFFRHRVQVLSFNTVLFFFHSFVQSNFSIQPVALSEDSIPHDWFSQTCCLEMLIPVKNFPRHFVTIEGELVPLEFFCHLLTLVIYPFIFVASIDCTNSSFLTGKNTYCTIF